MTSSRPTFIYLPGRGAKFFPRKNRKNDDNTTVHSEVPTEAQISQIQTDPDNTTTLEASDAQIRSDFHQATTVLEPSESKIRTYLDKETTILEPSESTIRTDLDKETTILEPSESTIRTYLDKETTILEPSESTIRTDLDKETTILEPSESKIRDLDKETTILEPSESKIRPDLCIATAILLEPSEPRITAEVDKTTRTLETFDAEILSNLEKATTFVPTKVQIPVHLDKNATGVEPAKAKIRPANLQLALYEPESKPDLASSEIEKFSEDKVTNDHLPIPWVKPKKNLPPPSPVDLLAKSLSLAGQGATKRDSGQGAWISRKFRFSNFDDCEEEIFEDFTFGSLGFKKKSRSKTKPANEAWKPPGPGIPMKPKSTPLKLATKLLPLPGNRLQPLPFRGPTKVPLKVVENPPFVRIEPPPPAFLTQMDEGKQLSKNGIPLRCDRTSDNVDDQRSGPMNRFRHLEYLNRKYRIEKQSWINKYIPNERVLRVQDLKPSYLTNALEKRLGPMDTDSERFKNLLKVFKDVLYGQIMDWTNTVNELWEEGLESTYAEPPVDPISDFSVEEVKTFDINPLTNKSKLDLFIVPRVAGFSGNEKAETDFQPICAQKDEKNIETGHQNKHKFRKPKHQCQQQLPREGTEGSPQILPITPIPVPPDSYSVHSFQLNLVVQEHKQMQIDGLEFVGVKLRFTLRSHIRPNFLGISEAGFLSNFRNKEGYLPDLTSLNLRKVNDLIWKLPHIFYHWPINGDNNPRSLNPTSYDPDKVLLPSYLRGLVCEQQVFLWRIWHLYLVVLSLNSSQIPIEDLPEALYEVFDVEFNCKLWGFMSMNDFCNYLARRWPRPGILIVFEKYGNSDSDCFLLVRRFDRNPSKKLQNIEEEETQGYFGSVSFEAKPTQTLEILEEVGQISDGYADQDLRIPLMQEEVEPGLKIRCMAPVIYSPDHFFVRPISFTGMLFRMENALQKDMEAEIKYNITEGEVDKHLLNPFGHFVVARTNDGWRRAMTLRRDIGVVGTFKIVLIDSGSYNDLHYTELRYLPLKYAKFPALTIPCQLVIPEEFKECYGTTERFDRYMISNFDRFTYNAELTVTFLEWKGQLKFPGWDVELQKLEGVDTDIVQVDDLVIQLCRDFDEQESELLNDSPVSTDDSLAVSDGGLEMLVMDIELPICVAAEIPKDPGDEKKQSVENPGDDKNQTVKNPGDERNQNVESV